MTTAPRIGIADDHPVFRSGLRSILERDGFTVVSEAADGDTALTDARRLKPQAVVLDLSMPGRPTREVATTILTELPGTAVVILTMHEDPRYLREFLRIGVQGYLLKKSTGSELAQAIRTALAGGRHVDPALAGSVLGGMLGPERGPAAAGPETPTPREREVGGLLALGHTNQEIADRLGVSVRTVESHRASLMRKLGLATRAGLVRWAMDEGLLNEGSS